MWLTRAVSAPAYWPALGRAGDEGFLKFPVPLAVTLLAKLWSQSKWTLFSRVLYTLPSIPSPGTWLSRPRPHPAVPNWEGRQEHADLSKPEHVEYSGAHRHCCCRQGLSRDCAFSVFKIQAGSTVESPGKLLTNAMTWRLCSLAVWACQAWECF